MHALIGLEVTNASRYKKRQRETTERVGYERSCTYKHGQPQQNMEDQGKGGKLLGVIGNAEKADDQTFEGGFLHLLFSSHSSLAKLITAGTAMNRQAPFSRRSI